MKFSILKSIIAAWIAYIVCIPLLYFGLTLNFGKLFGLPSYGVSDAIAGGVNGISPIILKVLVAELVLYTVAWGVVAGLSRLRAGSSEG